MQQFPEILRQWRTQRRLSQLDLALEANVSSRHISFLETGRSRPSRDMVIHLGDALSIPLEVRNQMLTSAGFAPKYQKRDWDDAAMAPIRRWKISRSNSSFRPMKRQKPCSARYQRATSDSKAMSHCGTPELSQAQLSVSQSCREDPHESLAAYRSQDQRHQPSRSRAT